MILPEPQRQAREHEAELKQATRCQLLRADQRPWVLTHSQISTWIYIHQLSMISFLRGIRKVLQENTIPVPPNSEVGASQVAGSWRQITSMIYPLKQLKVTRPSLSFPQILPRIRQFFSVLQLGLSHRSWDSASW